MRRLFSIALAVLLIAGCRGQEGFRSGDLVFIGLPAGYNAETGSMDQAIVQATGGDGLNLIHTAILEMSPEGPMIIDATLRYGVDRHPLDTMLTQFTLGDGSLPVFIVKRLRKGFSPRFLDMAKSFCGQPYDKAFLPDNGAMYCTELVQASYTSPDGTPLFPSEPMNFKDADGQMPPYWTWLFGLMGMDVPQGVPGTNPRRMSESELLVPVEGDLISLSNKKMR